jgi:DNA-binding CsgD family transcriptional regulator
VVASLSSRDLRGVLEFVELAWSAAGERPFPSETLEALARLIPCEEAVYCELDRVRRRNLEYVDSHGVEGLDAGVADNPDDVFWQIEPDHPLCRHQRLHFDFSAVRLSDVLPTQRLLNSRIFADWFRPQGFVAELELGVAPSHVVTRNFVLSRSSGDFSERDREVLNLLAPHLRRIRELSALLSALRPNDEGGAPLTSRERQVLELVAEGLTNAAVAEQLWIAPGTVKKHLDNAYAKLGASTRTEAVARMAARRPHVTGSGFARSHRERT